MDTKQVDNELSQWLSTYGLITAQRILDKYHISLPQKELINVLKHPFSFYQRLIQIPLKNVLNGIIFDQANDYHVYAQKLFIDYLLSGEGAKGEGAQGEGTRESLENERKTLVLLGEEFNKAQIEHNSLIASSQAILIKITREWTVAFESGLTLAHATLHQHDVSVQKNLVKEGINYALIHLDLTPSNFENNHIFFVDKVNEIVKILLTTELKEQLNSNLAALIDIIRNLEDKTHEFYQQVNAMNETVRSFRTQFYQCILRVTELINLLPDYRVNQDRDAINRASLHFDKSIGDS